jgi:hypothetical protein
MSALPKLDLENESTEVEKPKFEVHDLSSATWVMRKLRDFNNQDTEVKRVAQEQIVAIQKWQQKELEKNESSREYMEGLLSDYLHDMRQTDPKARISTPYGTVSTRKQREGVNWPNDKKLVQSLSDQGLTQYLKPNPKPDKTAIKKDFHFVGDHFISNDGMILDGPTIKPASETTMFKFNE